jgi:tetratricopeptide (TPR) repeat protein
MRWLIARTAIVAYAVLALAFARGALGRPAATLAREGEAHMSRGLAQLNDAALPGAVRLERYHVELGAAESQLVASLRARPTSARTLAELAAARFELDPPFDERAVARHLSAIRAASLLAPVVPQVQIQLGELLVKMGRLDEAKEYLRRAVELDPRTNARAVAVLRAGMLTAPEIAASLPRTPEVLAALASAYHDDGADLDYLALVERALDEGGASYRPLLQSYASACFAAALPHRAVERLGALGTLADREAEAMRLVQLSRAHGVLGDRERAIETAREAERRLPALWTAEQLGGALAAAGDGAGAIDAFRRALAAAARAGGDAKIRARLHRRIGQAEELRGQGGRAFEAYRRAVELDPEEPVATRRLAEMRAAARG